MGKKDMMRKILFGLCVLFMACSIVAIGKNRNVKAADVPAETNGNYEYRVPDIPTVRSGDYEYQILDETKKTASLRKIYNYGEEVNIPSVIDGYSIICIGIREEDSYGFITMPNPHGCDYYGVDYNKAAVFAEEDNTVKKLVIPDGVLLIYENAFYKMKALEQVSYPDTLAQIHWNNFNDSVMLKRVEFPDGIFIQGGFENVVLDEVVLKGSIYAYDEDHYLCSIAAKDVIVKGKQDIVRVSFGLDNKTQRLSVNKSISKLIISSGHYDEVVLENPNTILSIDMDESTVGKVRGTIKDIKAKRNKKNKKYTYSWKTLKILKEEFRKESKWVGKYKFSYVISYKKANGKYKKLKTVKKPSVILDKKKTLKIEAQYTLK